MIASAKSRSDKKHSSCSSDPRLRRIQQLPLEYIDSSEFHQQHAEQVILGQIPDAERAAKPVKPPDGLTPYLAALYRVPLLTSCQERHLFRRYNYLKHAAARLRESLDLARPDEQLMDDIEELFTQAEQARNQIIEANLRLVVSLAKPRASISGELQDLISDGNMALIRAVEKFDYMLGNKFSTYATWAIRRSLARSIPSAATHRKRFCNGMDEAIAASPDRGDSRSDDEAAGDEWRGKLQQMFGQLTRREKYIVVRRFGLVPDGQRKTLQAIGDEIGVTKERVRQLEHRAIDKLKAALADSQ